jgi:large subunit ribosomal protein L25
MRIAFELSAEPRNDQGKGASRRLRHSGKVPAILYGAHLEPTRLALEHHKLLALVSDEKFYSSIISISVGAQKQPVIVKDVQMHPAHHHVVHVDLQRVLENEKIRLHVPIHFKGEAAAPGVKSQGGVVSHHMADMEVVCLPKDLPEYIELDLSAMNLNDSLYLNEIKVPAGVTISGLAHGANPPVVSIHAPRVAEPEPTAEVEVAPVEGAVAAAPAEGAPGAKKEEGKKEEAKKEEGAKETKKEGGKK